MSGAGPGAPQDGGRREETAAWERCGQWPGVTLTWRQRESSHPPRAPAPPRPRRPRPRSPALPKWRPLAPASSPRGRSPRPLPRPPALRPQRPAPPAPHPGPGRRAPAPPPLPAPRPRALPTIPRPAAAPGPARPLGGAGGARLAGPIVPGRLALRVTSPLREPRCPQLTALGGVRPSPAPGDLTPSMPCLGAGGVTGRKSRTPGSFSKGDSRLRTRGPVQGDWDGAGSDPSFPGPSSLESEHQLYGI